MRIAEGVEGRQLDHRFGFAFEQHRQHDDIVRRRFAEAGRDVDIVVGNVGDQDAFASRACTGPPGLRRREIHWRDSCACCKHSPPSNFITGWPLSTVVDIEDALLRIDQRRQFGQAPSARRSSCRAGLAAFG